MEPHELEQLGPELSAYLDGELDSERRAEIDQLLAESRQARQLLEDLRGISAHISQLPREAAPVQLSATLKKATQERMPTTLVTRPKRRMWWLIGVEVSAAAAVLLFAVYLGWSGFGKVGGDTSSSATVNETPTVAMAEKDEALSDDRSIRSKPSKKQVGRSASQEDATADRHVFTKAKDATEAEYDYDGYFAGNSPVSDIQLFVSAPTADSYRRNVMAVNDNLPATGMAFGKSRESIQPDRKLPAMTQQEFDGSLVDVMNVVNAIRDKREAGVGIKLSNIPVYAVERQPRRGAKYCFETPDDSAGRSFDRLDGYDDKSDGNGWSAGVVQEDSFGIELKTPEGLRMRERFDPRTWGPCRPDRSSSADREHSEPLPMFEGVPIVDPVLTMIRDSLRELLRPMQGVTESYRVLIQVERVDDL